MLSSFDVDVQVLRLVLFWIAAALAIVFGLDWLVRTRRLNAFGPLARFFRGTIDPWLVPIERRVVRAGGTPASAPWWALAVVVVGGIILLALLSYIRGMIVEAAIAGEYGSRGIIRLAIQWTFLVLRFAILVRVLSSWISISPYSRWIRWSFVCTEWIIRPLRRIVPTVGMIDITPIVAWLALGLAEWVVVSALA